MKAIGYVRVSTEEQAEEGVSLAAQEERIRAYAKLYGLELVYMFREEGVSASTLERPKLQEALRSLESGDAEALIVAKLDRLTRSLRDLLDLIETYFKQDHDEQYALMSVAEQLDPRTASGRLVMNILGAVAQWELETISERTKAALKYKRDRGEYTGGGVPYGQMLVDGRLYMDPEEQAAIDVAKRLHRQGMALTKIGRKLLALGYHPRLGRVWAAQQIRRLVKEGGGDAEV
ncbi:MAG: recombinase family protein [Gammaproteobacteria bacterium]|nr:recombinase family protein [Gammaproteobacteria bacterium]